MGRIFRLNHEEMRFLQYFLEIPELPWHKPAQFKLMNEDEIQKTAASLQGKQYLFKNDKGEYLTEEWLEHLLEVCGSSWGYFFMENREILFFKKDEIVLVSQKGQEFEIMWLPVLPLAIGHIANILSPFLNETSNQAETASSEDYESILEGFQAERFTMEIYSL